ncbi:MAG: endonuclease III domain-containing protein [Deltaproteobacteria bacterium]|jgi:endonuclease III related protein|nr:endonuclease III domain-containing protein [Deltaproteobacteria bacterium]MCK5513085.1 endonuclease III domain-containing protein [Deltaproteobacteria bacterium]NOQ86328.1 endonuclease III domain-containing protein [Deltaproteobacteria bacterium]
MRQKRKSKKLLKIYQKLYNAIGPRHWWPGDSPFEVIIGAILTQNTSWKNVETAIKALKEYNLLDPVRLLKVDEGILANTIKSSGFFNIKTKRIKNFIRFLFENYQGSLEKMFSENLTPLREKLLKINGIGPETADSILLYAGGKPIFVVDAYTRKILLRHNLISKAAGYSETQALFMENLEKDVRMFNEYHALLVYVGKYFCKRIPGCENCPMRGL